MYCIYRVTEMSRGSEGAPYFERIDDENTVIPLFSDGVAYVTIENGYFELKNEAGELFFAGKEKTLGRALSKLRVNTVLCNGVDYDK